MAELLHTPNTILLASGSGTTVQEMIERSQKDSRVNFNVTDVICNTRGAGVLGRVAELNEEYSLEIQAHLINSSEYPRGPANLDHPSMTDEESEAITQIAKNSGATAIGMAGYNKEARGVVLDEFKGRFTNTHPGYLADRAEEGEEPESDTKGMHGAQPSRWALDQGRETTDHTFHLVEEGYDMGLVLVRNTVTIHPDTLRLYQFADGLREAEAEAGRDAATEVLFADVRDVEKRELPVNYSDFLGELATRDAA